MMNVYMAQKDGKDLWFPAYDDDIPYTRKSWSSKQLDELLSLLGPGYILAEMVDFENGSYLPLFAKRGRGRPRSHTVRYQRRIPAELVAPMDAYLRKLQGARNQGPP